VTSRAFLCAEGAAMTSRDFLFLPGNARFADLGLLLLRCATGVFLIYQSHDNVFSVERMDEFVKFLAQFGFPAPATLGPLSVYFQFAAGIGFILGLFTRWLGLITCFQFIVAVWMVHSPDPFPTWWPALVLVFLGLYFGLRGSGRYGLDALMEHRSGNRRRR
jgi:putative oxidoreductase